VRESAVRTLAKAEDVLRARDAEVRSLKEAVGVEAARAGRAEAKLKAAKERLLEKNRELDAEKRRADALAKRNAALLALNSRLLASSAPSAESVKGVSAARGLYTARLDVSRQIGKWARDGEALAASMELHRGLQLGGRIDTEQRWEGGGRVAEAAAAWEERVLRLEVQAAALLAH
jgi:hypothetical protein